MTKTEQIALIDRAFAALPDMTRGLTEEKWRLYYLVLEDERKYRRCRPRTGLSKSAAAKLFSVKHIAESLQKPRRYKVVDILAMRADCLYAQALVQVFGKDIKAAWKAAGIQIADVLALDYVELMK